MFRDICAMSSFEPLSFADLKGKKVGIWGVGKEGLASYFYLKSLGNTPLLADRQVGPSDLDGESFEFVELREGDISPLFSCDVVIKSPGISRYCVEAEELRKHGVRVVGGMALFLTEVNKENTVMVTGTKGKSTTVSLITHLLRSLGEMAGSFGNLGTVPWDPSSNFSDCKWAVIEASSFQIADLWSAGATAVITALAPDHLDWHRSDVETYYRDKLRLCSLPGVKRVIVNGEDGNLRQKTALLGDNPYWVSYEEPLVEKYLSDFSLPGIHNKMDALLALEVVKNLGIDYDERSLIEAFSTFLPLPHRLEKVAEYRGIQFVDDGLATNALPTISALRSYIDCPVAIILGGSDRGIDYRGLVDVLHKHPRPICILTLSEAGKRIAETYLSDKGESITETGTFHFASVGAHAQLSDLYICETLGEALRKAFGWALSFSDRHDMKPPVVLLSPAAPSFSQYKNYLERSEDFITQVKMMIDEVERSQNVFFSGS